MYHSVVRILILTSKDHPYANLLLGTLLRNHVFAGDQVTVFEQDWILPKKGAVHGLLAYLHTSGFRYVFAQALKQYLFRFCRAFAWLFGRRQSPFFPYASLHNGELSRELFQNLATPGALERIRALTPDLLLSLYSKEVLPLALLEMPTHGCVNLHPALLPAYRGVSPTFWCLANGENIAGVTVHTMDAGIDTGMLIAQKDIATEGCTTEHALYVRCTLAGAKIVADFLRALKKGETIPHIPLSAKGKGSYYSLPTKEAVQQFRKRGYRFFRVGEFLFPEKFTRL